MVIKTKFKVDQTDIITRKLKNALKSNQNQWKRLKELLNKTSPYCKSLIKKVLFYLEQFLNLVDLKRYWI